MRAGGSIRRGTIITVVGALGLTATGGHLGAAPTGTNGDDDATAEVEVDKVTTGYWRGAAWASGTANGVIEGMNTSVSGSIVGNFQFVAAEETDGPGSVTGTWDHSGVAGLSLSGMMQGQAVTGGGVLQFGDATPGSMSGDTRLILLDGDMATTGEMGATVGGVSNSTPINNVTTMPTLEVRVLGGTCETVHGDWAYSFENELAAQGLSATFGGQWTAWRDPDQDLDGGVEALQEAFETEASGGEADMVFSGSPLFDEAMDLLADFNAYTQLYPDWEIGEVLALASDAEWLLGELRATSGCERVFLGEDRLEAFDSQLTGAVQALIEFGVQLDDVPVGAWQMLANLGVRTGAVGAGAVDAEAAAHAEASLRGYAEAELNLRLNEDGSLPVTPETQALVGTSAMMGWDLTIDGITTPAVEWWAQIAGSL